MALLSLSSLFIIPLSCFRTMSHLTVPGAMTSISSITGRLVLISLSCKKTGKTASNTNAALRLLKYFTYSHTQTHTLKLLICACLFFGPKVVLIQARMILSPTFSPSPRSDKTCTVYLKDNKEDRQLKPLKSVQNGQPNNISPVSEKSQSFGRCTYLLISCQTSARVCIELPSFKFCPPMPTREK